MEPRYDTKNHAEESVNCPVDLTIEALSVEYVKVPVRAIVNGAPFNPTVDVVLLAIVTHDVEPAPADFHVGSWETNSVTGQYLARILVGPGQGPLALADGYYDVYVQVNSNPETPVLSAGVLQIV